MANIPESVLRLMARMSDDEFLEWAGEIGFTLAPEPMNETVSNFRIRVLDTLDRYGQEIERVQNG